CIGSRLPRDARSPSLKRSIELQFLCHGALPTIAVGQQALLVIVELLARFRGKLHVGSQNDCVHWACLLAQAAIGACCHDGVVASRAPRTVDPARAGLDDDALRGANSFTELAGDAALFAIGIAAQHVFAPEARRAGLPFEGMIYGRLGLEQIPQG